MLLHRRGFLQRVAAATALPLLAAGPARAFDATFFRIGTGSTSGTYFRIGGIIASAISNPPGSRSCDRGGSCGVPGLIAVVQSTEGSVSNVEAINGGLLESGFSQADVAFWAYHGEGPYAGGEPLTKLRAIANLYPETIQLITRVGSGIQTVSDLRGKRISLDLMGSGSMVDALLVLEAWGLSPKDFEALNLAPGTAIDQLRRGEIDGLFLVAGTPTGSIADLARETQLYLVPIAGPNADSLRKRYPFFTRQQVEAGTYQSVPATETLSVGAQWLIGADIDADLVYGITAALWHPNTREMLDSGPPNGRLITFGSALDGLGVPLHPGARRYYEERGVTLIETEPEAAE